MKQKGFTLIELLVVVAIIGILASVGVVAYNGYTKSAKIKATQTNYRNIEKKLLTSITACMSGIEVTFGPFCTTGCSPKTRTLNCTVRPSSYSHPRPADTHAYLTYREAKYSYKSCYDNKISAFGDAAPGGHGWAPGAGWSNSTCSGIKDFGIELGQSVLGYQGHPSCSSGRDIACLKTNVGDKDGNDAFLKSEINLCLF